MLTNQQEEMVKNLNKLAKFQHIPKIFLTIKGLTEDRINGYKAGCDAYISKPFDPEELEAIILNLVRQGRSKISWILDTYLKIKKIRLKFVESTTTNYTIRIKLTTKESEILEKVIQGKKNLQIAQELKTSKRNIERHIGRLLNKTNTKSRFELSQLI